MATVWAHLTNMMAIMVRPDRYDWTVQGKMVKLSQQNNYNSVMTPYDQLLQPGHANPDAMRYELRRQWVVEGNLKGEARHIYARRVLRLDEDSWQMTAGEMYDGRGELWRVQNRPPDYRPEAKTCWTTGGEFIYDLLAGRYMGVGMKSQRPANYVTGLERLTRTIIRRPMSAVWDARSGVGEKNHMRGGRLFGRLFFCLCAPIPFPPFHLIGP